MVCVYMYSMYINKTKTLANGLQIHRVMYVLVYYIYIYIYVCVGVGVAVGVCTYSNNLL